MKKIINKSLRISEHMPSKKLQNRVKELYDLFPQNIVAERLGNLSRTLEQEAESFEGTTANALRIKNELEAAASDLIKVKQMLYVIAHGKPLKGVENDPDDRFDNDHLKLFEGYSPLTPRIHKCLEVAAEFAMDKYMDDLEHYMGTEEIPHNISVRMKNMEEATTILGHINELQKIATAEIYRQNREVPISKAG